MKKEMGKLGTTDMGIPSYDRVEPETEKLPSLTNRFSSQHDCTQDEIMRLVGRGSGASDMKKKERY